MKVQCHTIGSLGTNCYFLINEDTKETLVVDPAEHGDVISRKLQEQGLALKGILLTHGHGDHIMAVEELRSAHKVPVLAHEAEEKLLADPSLNLSFNIFRKKISIPVDELLKDGDIVELAGLSLKVLHTPGHTLGGCCYYSEADGVLISGDTLFCGSVGRTDFPGGSMSTLVRAIREKLLVLPDETRVYPGHSEMTTIGQEKKWNPFLS